MPASNHAMAKHIFHQFDCKEENRPDYRQARAVLKYRPDIIIFETPEKNGTPDSPFNKYGPGKKPQKKIEERLNSLEREAKRFGYAKSDIRTLQNINQLWRTGHEVLLFNVDAPLELRGEWFDAWEGMYPCASKNWLWWVRIYLRERIMANHLKSILKKYKKGKPLTILIFLQVFHWRHVEFLLSDPSKSQIWNYYFGKFQKVERSAIGSRIKKVNKIFYKYWKKFSDFKQ